MDGSAEIELKLEIDPDASIGGDTLPGEARDTVAMVSTYFDTPERDLADAGYSLRIRAVGGERVQTIKASGASAAGLFVRPEWECAVDGDTPRLDAAGGLLALAIPAEARARIVPIFSTDVERTIRVVRTADSEIELAIDRGQVRAGTRSAPLCEIELELKAGAPQALFDLARRIDRSVPLRLGVLSKSERGYALAEPWAGGAVKATPIALDPDGDVRDGFATIAQACIRQFRLNEAMLIEAGAPEPLHQARVGLRRLRSAFSLFKPLFEGDDRADHLRAELKWLAGELGEVRNLDVLVTRAQGAVLEQLVAAREHTYAKVQIELASARTRLLMIDLIEWLALGAWRNDPADPKTGARSIHAYAGAVLDSQRRRVKRRGRHLAKLDHHDRHEVRIEAKKLRYATEFFASLFADGKKARRRHKTFLRAMEALQDVLGELNDRVTGPQVLERLGIDAPMFKTGRSTRKLLRHAEDAYDELIDTKRFWR